MLQDDLKLPDDSGKVPKLNGMVGSSIPGYEIISLLVVELVVLSILRGQGAQFKCGCIKKSISIPVSE